MGLLAINLGPTKKNSADNAPAIHNPLAMQLAIQISIYTFTAEKHDLAKMLLWLNKVKFSSVQLSLALECNLKFKGYCSVYRSRLEIDWKFP